MHTDGDPQTGICTFNIWKAGLLAFSSEKESPGSPMKMRSRRHPPGGLKTWAGLSSPTGRFLFQGFLQPDNSQATRNAKWQCMPDVPCLCSHQQTPCPFGWPTAGATFCNRGCKCPQPIFYPQSQQNWPKEHSQPFWQRTFRSRSQPAPVALVPHSPSKCPFWGGSWSSDHQRQEAGVLRELAWLPSCPSFLSANCCK